MKSWPAFPSTNSSWSASNQASLQRNGSSVAFCAGTPCSTRAFHRTHGDAVLLGHLCDEEQLMQIKIQGVGLMSNFEATDN
jgi:hypothetical protein